MEQISWLVQFFIQRNLTLLIVILVVLLVRLLMQRMPKRYVYCLWAIVGIRMLFSFEVVSPVSIYQFFPWADPQAVSFRMVSQTEKEESDLTGEANNLAAPSDEADIAAGLANPARQAADQGASKEDAASWQAGAIASEEFSGDGSGKDLFVAEGDPQGETLGGRENFAGGDLPGSETVSNPSKDQDLPAGQGAAAEGALHGSESEETSSDSKPLEERDLAGLQAAGKDLQGLPQGAEGMAPNLTGADQGTRNAFVTAFFAVWLAGLIAVLCVGMLSYLRIRRLVKEAVHLDGNVWECDGIATPFVLGIVRPRIFIPFHLEEEKRLLVLEHERQHLKRLDPLARLLAYVLLAVYWINPLVWFSYFCFVRDQEMRCDEAVLSKLGAEHKKEYGMTLLSFATQERFMGFSPVAFGESDAEKRIKNVLNYKKPDFWIILVCMIILVCIGIICLTEAKKSKDTKDGTGTEQTGSAQGTEGADETKQGGEPVEEKVLYQSTVSADLNGDGEKELIQINDYTSGKTTLNTKIGGKEIKEHAMQSVQMIKTDCVAADLTGDGIEELITLQSSPMLASTYNWPGKVTILQVKDGEWREFSDDLFYPETGEYAYQDYYPKKITDSICINVKIEPTKDGAILHLTYPLSYELAHGMGGALRIDCTYRATPKEGWEVCYYFLSHDYTSLQYQTGIVSGLHSISVGYKPWETNSVDKKVADKLFSAVPFQHYFEQLSENEALTLNMGEDGTFTGTDVSNGGPQTRICEYTGKVTNLRMVNTLQYVFHVEELTFPAPDQITQKDRTQYVTAKPFGMEEGDEFLLYLPGYPVTNLPSVVLRGLEDAGRPNWYNYHLEELPCYVLYNLERGTVYISGYLDEYVGQRMETVGLYGDLSYPCGPNGGFPIQTVTQLCADACGVFVQKVKNPLAQSQNFMAFVRNQQLADYLEYKTKHFLYQLKDGRWRLEIKQFQEVTVSGARVLHVTGIPKYYAVSEGTESTLHVLNSYGNVAKGSWGTIHFLIDREEGQLYIRDWYWDSMDSRDIALRGSYSVEEAYDFWEHPVDYAAMSKQNALKIGSQIMAMGLPVNCEETWNNTDPEYRTSYIRKYFYDDILVGGSRGYGESQDYVDDLDDDGFTEIICYAKSMETGDYDDITVFRRKGNIIYKGRLLNTGLLNLENCDTLSYERRISQHYNPDSHQLYVTYPLKGGDYGTVPFTYADMTFTEYSYVTPSDWKEKYADYVRRIDADQFALIYLDDDEIPEVYCEINSHAMMIVTMHEGKIQERYLNRDGLLYLEKKGIYYTVGGNMGYFPFEIVSLKDGEFTVLASGYQKSEYVANAESTDPDQLTEFITYDWNGQSVTEEEYYRNIDSLMDRGNAIRPDSLYSKDDILKLLGMEITSLAVG